MFKNNLQNVPITNLNKYLHSDAREIEMIINKGKQRQLKILKKSTANFRKLIIAVDVSVLYVYISYTCMSSRLEYNSRFDGSHYL